MKYTYLMIDLFSILFPFIFSFHPRLKFYKTWPAFFPAVLISGLIFIGWDMYFTNLKVWGFNPTYLTGLYVGNLPLEEILFFLCIPYACVFTYTSLPQKGFSIKYEFVLTLIIIISSVLISVLFYHQLYTSITFAALAIIIGIARFLLKISWLSRFYQTYLLLLIPFLIVNGLLTGTGLAAPIVWYNSRQIFNMRVMTIPVEDIFYGMTLILLNLLIYNWFLKRKGNLAFNFKSLSIPKTEIN